MQNLKKQHNFWQKLLQGSYLGLVFLFLYLPIIILIVFSFNNSKARGHWTGFSLRWYEELWHDSTIIAAMSNTIAVAVIATFFATVIGTFAAIGLYYMRKRRRKLILAVNSIPVLNPDIVTAVALMVLFRSINLDLGFFSLTLAHIVFTIPYVVLSVMPRLNIMEPALPEAAMDLGATPWQCVFKIIIPDIKPAIFQAALLAFTLSIDDFVISFFTTGNGVSNVSTHVFSMTKRGINPVINALSTIMFVVMLILLIVINYRTGRVNKKASVAELEAHGGKLEDSPLTLQSIDEANLLHLEDKHGLTDESEV